MKRTEIRLPDDVYEELRRLAFVNNTSLNKEMVEAIVRGLGCLVDIKK